MPTIRLALILLDKPACTAEGGHQYLLLLLGALFAGWKTCLSSEHSSILRIQNAILILYYHYMLLYAMMRP